MFLRRANGFRVANRCADTLKMGFGTAFAFINYGGCERRYFDTVLIVSLP
jgi:hypothetical protein